MISLSSVCYLPKRGELWQVIGCLGPPAVTVPTPRDGSTPNDLRPRIKRLTLICLLTSTRPSPVLPTSFNYLQWTRASPDRQSLGALLRRNPWGNTPTLLLTDTHCENSGPCPHPKSSNDFNLYVGGPKPRGLSPNFGVT